MSQSQSPHHHGVVYQKQSDHFERIVPHVVTPSRSVGELVYSLLPLEDSGLHLVDGSVLYGNGPYGAFVDYIQGLYSDGNHTALFETEANWQTSVTTYGACGKFVVDMTNDTVRLPKLSKGFLEATIDASALGDLVEAGLPNITGESQLSGVAGISATGTGAFRLDTISNNNDYQPVSSDSLKFAQVNIDASRSSGIYGNSATVQPQSIKGFIYMVLANKVRNPMNLDITQAIRGAAVPVGTIIMSANTTVPQGYLLCDGSAVGRGTYPELFTAIGTTYGDGDGSTTFNLPDLIGKFVEGGSVAGTEHEAGLPNITGYTEVVHATVRGSSQIGALKDSTYAGLGSESVPNYTGATNAKGCLDFKASNSNPIYGNSNTVQPPSLTALPCIKAFSSVVSDGTVVIGNLASEVQAKNGEWAGHNAMPSGQYINLALPANNGTITMTTDGYLTLCGTVSNGGWFSLQRNGVNTYTSGVNPTGGGVAATIAVSVGDIITFVYDGFSGVAGGLRLYYANGSVPSI